MSEIPPITGIARRKDALYDIFADLTAQQQRGVLEILNVIHRQALREHKPQAVTNSQTGDS